MNNLSSFGQVFSSLSQNIGMILNRLVELERNVKDLQKQISQKAISEKESDDSIVKKEQLEEIVTSLSNKITTIDDTLKNLESVVRNCPAPVQAPPAPVQAPPVPVPMPPNPASPAPSPTITSDITEEPSNNITSSIEEDIDISIETKKTTAKPKRGPAKKKP